MSSSKEQPPLNFGRNKYVLGYRIGGGSFGEIYHAKNTKTNEDVACKMETIHPNKAKLQLRREAKIYNNLFGEVGIPKVRWFGSVGNHNLMVMDLLGKSLEDLFNYCNRRFSLKTVLLLAHELIGRLETIHNKGYIIHRDIKPENFLVGKGRERHTIYIIDFGLAKHYKNPKTNKHIGMHTGNDLTGTARYASVNAHEGLVQSRRDDLFSVGYVLMYFLRGSLPWQGLTQQQIEQEQEQQRLRDQEEKRIKARELKEREEKEEQERLQREKEEKEKLEKEKEKERLLAQEALHKKLLEEEAAKKRLQDQQQQREKEEAKMKDQTKGWMVHISIPYTYTLIYPLYSYIPSILLYTLYSPS